MKILIILSVTFLSCSSVETPNPKPSNGLEPAVVVVGQTDIARLESGLKVNMDSIKSLNLQIRTLRTENVKVNATLAKQNVLLAKKDTVWFVGLQGFGTKTRPFDLRGINTEVLNIKSNISIIRGDLNTAQKDITNIKAALPVIRNDILLSKVELIVAQKNDSNFRAALVTIRQNIADIQLKLDKIK